MNSRSSGGWLEAFFTGKGFYIVLFLCAAVIGASAWMMAAGNRTMGEDVIEVSNTNTGRTTTETVILPPPRTDAAALEEAAQDASQVFQEQTQEQEEPVVETAQTETAPVDLSYAWPLQGELDRLHDPYTLHYDDTMGDWRTHEGVDILAPLGETVTAARAGTVQSVRHDDLLGTVVTVNHGDGICTVYANLAEQTAVQEGEWVERGSVIGAVGATALGESSQESHLHFALLCNGVTQNPLEYLPS